MNMNELKVKVTFTNEVLGMSPSDPEIYREYIASNAPDADTIEDEVAAVGIDETVENKMTVFPRDNEGIPCFFDYQLRGFIKDAIGMLRRVPGTKCSKVTNYKKVVDGLIFVKDRMNTIRVNGDMGNCQRSLRTDGIGGSRTALAISESAPAGSTMEFTFLMMDSEKLEPVIRECLDYGVFRGMGQWRNSGKGTFTWEEMQP